MWKVISALNLMLKVFIDKIFGSILKGKVIFEKPERMN